MQFALWQYRVAGLNVSNSTILFGRGGFQEQRGCEQECGERGASSSKNARQFYAENIFEELDAPNEFYLDAAGGRLYYVANASDFDPGKATFVAPAWKTVVDVRGDQKTPVAGFRMVGVGVTQTRVTYFEDYEAVTSGDYTYHRGAAVFVEGAVAPTIRDCRFVRVDGNAVFLSNFVRNASITDSEFAFTGDNGITMIGSTDRIDGTSGNQPRYSTIAGNLLREIGQYQKQVLAACQPEAHFDQPNDQSMSWTTGLVFTAPIALLTSASSSPPSVSLSLVP